MKSINVRILATPMLVAAQCLVLGSTPAGADKPAPFPGTKTVATQQKFDALMGRLERAITDNGMGLVGQARASRGAASHGVKIPGNTVVKVFRNDYAVRMLAASVPAGIEAPLRIYVTENADGSASLTYRKPSAVFAAYGNAKLDAMSKELDPIFEKIVRDAAGK